MKNYVSVSLAVILMLHRPLPQEVALRVQETAFG